MRVSQMVSLIPSMLCWTPFSMYTADVFWNHESNFCPFQLRTLQRLQKRKREKLLPLAYRNYMMSPGSLPTSACTTPLLVPYPSVICPPFLLFKQTRHTFTFEPLYQLSPLLSPPSNGKVPFPHLPMAGFPLSLRSQFKCHLPREIFCWPPNRKVVQTYQASLVLDIFLIYYLSSLSQS